MQNWQATLVRLASLIESRKLWGSTDRELLAVRDCMKKITRFLWGRKFVVVTYHEPLLGLKEERFLDEAPGKHGSFTL